MQFINSKVTNIKCGFTDEDTLRHIELCGRVAYKSENNVTEDSYKKFIEHLKKLRHFSVLEHGTMYFTLPLEEFDIEECCEGVKFVLFSPYSKWVIPEDSKFIYVTTNYRVIEEGFANYKDEIFEILKYRTTPTQYHDQRYTFNIICSNGIAEQILRHRVFSTIPDDCFSFTKESTRYCNYTRDKFGSQLTYVIPYWAPDIKAREYINKSDYDNLSENTKIFLDNCLDTEKTYFQLLSKGCEAQQAREVLPKAIKTEMNMTGTLSQWKEFLKLRSPKYGATGVHKDMVVIADKIYDFFNNQNLL